MTDAGAERGPEPAFDEVIHPINRLQICSMLAPVDSLAFSAVRDALGVSDSVLSKQVKVLQEAGYVAVHKEPLNARVRAWIRLTPQGRDALAAHLAHLRRIADMASPPGGHVMPAHQRSGAHIALMSVPLHGHVNPLLGLAGALVSRGHRVTFVTGEDFTDLVEETGARAVGHVSTFPSRKLPGRAWLPEDDDGTLAVDAFRRECGTALPQVAAACADDVPDLVVYDTVTGYAPLLARSWGVPEVQFSPTHAFADGTGGRWSGSGAGALRADVPCVVAMPRSLQFEADKVSDRHVFVGPVQWRRRVHGSWSPPDGDRRVVFVSLGTTYNRRADIFRWCAQTFEQLDGQGWHVVIATGHGGADPGVLPSSAEVHEWVPQMEVLRHADLFVTAGGTGSVLEGLTHGVPLVVLPQAVEHFLTARQVAALGVGGVVPPDRLGPDTLRAAVEGVLTTPGTGERIAALRKEMAAAGGADAAADLVEAELSRHAAGVR